MNRHEPKRCSAFPVMTVAVFLAWGVLASDAEAGSSQEVKEPGTSLGDPRWLPWLGCWELWVETVDSYQEVDPEGVLVCLTPSEDARSTKITTLADGQVVLEETFSADGVRNPVDKSGCRGWQSAQWSGDGHRLFLHSDVVCENAVNRVVSGVSLLVPGDEWVDIQVVTAGELREVIVRRYHRASREQSAEAGYVVPEPESRAASSVRSEAARALSIEDIIESVKVIDTAAVEAALLETDARFDLDSAKLFELADAHVPADLIDLMVALSYPKYFGVDRRGEASQPTYPEESEYAVVLADEDRWAYGYPFYFAPFGYYSYWYWPYYGGHYVLTPGEPSGTGGRVVKGLGYTRVWPRDDGARERGGGGWQGGGSGRSDGSEGSVGREGYSSGSSSNRTAKPRPN